MKEGKKIWANMKELPKNVDYANCRKCLREDKIPFTNEFKVYGNKKGTILYFECMRCGKIVRVKSPRSLNHK